MCSVVDYSISGTEISGSYHINTYYDYVSGDSYTEDNKALLVDLVEKFYTYCQSALTYKSSVAGN